MFTLMPDPPVSRGVRRTRKPLLYGYLARWHDPVGGLDPFESGHLYASGYGRWISRGRLTDRMTVVLIEYTLALLLYDVRNVAPSYGERLASTAEALARLQVRPGGLTPDEVNCLAELQELHDAYSASGGDVIVGYDEGRRYYRPPPEDVASRQASIHQRFPTLMNKLTAEVTDRITSTDEIKLGRYAPPSTLAGKRERLRSSRGSDPNSERAS